MRQATQQRVDAALKGRGRPLRGRDMGTTSVSAPSTPALDTISAHAYAWGYDFVLPEAAMSTLQNGGGIANAFGKLLGVIPPELEPVSQLVEAHLEDGMASVKAADKGAGVYLTATWAAPDVLVATPMDWGFITSYLSEYDLVLDTAGGSTDPQTPVCIWPYKSYDNADQQWTYVNNLYLLNQQSGLVAEIAGSDPSDGATIQINKYTGALNQQWAICGDGFIRSLMNGNVLDVSGGSPDPGTPVISYHPKYPPTISPPTNQGWYAGFGATPSCNSLVTVITNNTSNDLMITGSTSNGTELSYPDGSDQMLPAGSVVAYTSTYGNDNAISFNIFDPTYSTTNSVASFDSHQHDCFAEGANVWADTFNWVDNYSLASPDTGWYVGSYGNSQPGILLCSVERSG